jgi:hypothetical protein
MDFFFGRKEDRISGAPTRRWIPLKENNENTAQGSVSNLELALKCLERGDFQGAARARRRGDFAMLGEESVDQLNKLFPQQTRREEAWVNLANEPTRFQIEEMMEVLSSWNYDTMGWCVGRVNNKGGVGSTIRMYFVTRLPASPSSLDVPPFCLVFPPVSCLVFPPVSCHTSKLPWQLVAGFDPVQPLPSTLRQPTEQSDPHVQ